MKNRLFLSVAAVALIAGAGLSHAQGPAGGGSAGGGAAIGGAAPAERAAPSGAGGAASERGAPGGGTMNRDAAEPRGGAGAPAQSTQSNDTSPGAKGDAKGGMNKNADTKDGAKDMNKNADTKSGADKDMNRNAQSKDGAKDGAKDGDRDNNRTTGQAGAGGKLTTEQRTKVTTVIRQQNIKPITNVNFSISVGTRVPRDVRFNPLPAEIITVYPDWRGYEFFLVGNDIIVVNPRTLEIVAVLDA